MTETTPGFATLSIHAGAQPDPATGARITPIYQTASYVFDNAEHAAALFGLQAFGNIYTRINNPTQSVLEARVAALEGGTAALAVASGHAAQFLIFHVLLEPGDEFIASRQLYGGSINQFNHSFKKFGWNVVWADGNDPASFEAAVTPKTKAIFIESIANPGGIVLDVPAIAAVAKKAGVPLIVDNTLATPYLFRPKEHGADIVVHSLTKFLGGQGNSIGGAIIDSGTFDWLKSGRYPAISQPNPSYHGLNIGETFGNFAFAIAARVLSLRDLGPAISPFNAFLILNGLETLPLRIERHVQNAVKVAEWLEKHPKVAWVNYAGLPGNRYHELAQRLTPKGAGAVFTFGLKGGYEAGVNLISNVKLFSLLANIGDVRSLIIHPASTTHAQLTPEQRESAGAGDDTVRLSVGIEDAADIIADLEQALASQ
ncbi:O-acetylhomoserine/O-acetylserine sulfhydrylase [Rhodomicrobium vannielii ATCC 17100]|uniref:O-succinylhomoserine sulfhydrylase n=1 Tax=Rhodomicrobium vannielii (strain ATCC 17100 / DSM 162 / LMG 4299 / NCIMB 10020 / ATH 3.1.1) TaxID=648757 RepID=E3I5U9_RHOVT|nr:O-acetylhomoserine aminocarboxypropyltransferase [Rhodomicrobium vannielii]ADP69452.1 O-acetylhomoserine/O-acetylserine sulfhydrylase [Rhodomicrobium vannielii ATCC 17100]